MKNKSKKTGSKFINVPKNLKIPALLLIGAGALGAIAIANGHPFGINGQNFDFGAGVHVFEHFALFIHFFVDAGGAAFVAAGDDSVVDHFIILGQRKIHRQNGKQRHHQRQKNRQFRFHNGPPVFSLV